jgi:hypothetical protein
MVPVQDISQFERLVEVVIRIVRLVIKDNVEKRVNPVDIGGYNFTTREISFSK